jgi:hypothetical protein
VPAERRRAADQRLRQHGRAASRLAVSPPSPVSPPFRSISLAEALEPQLGSSEPQAQPVLLGTDYRSTQVGAAAGCARQPFTTDPAIVERGLRGHVDTQNELARVLRDAGLSPACRMSRTSTWPGRKATPLSSPRSRASPTTMRKNSSALASARCCATVSVCSASATRKSSPSWYPSAPLVTQCHLP